MVRRVDPIRWQSPIADPKTGNPTEFFQRQWQNLRALVQEIIDAQAAAAAAQTTADTAQTAADAAQADVDALEAIVGCGGYEVEVKGSATLTTSDAGKVLMNGV